MKVAQHYDDNDSFVQPSLLTLPAAVLANIISHVSSKRKDVINICACHPSLWRHHYCRYVHKNSQDDYEEENDDLWRSLCRFSFPHSDNRVAHWPTTVTTTSTDGVSAEKKQRHLSWMTIYSILEVWSPREGFYEILNAYPWGMLLFLRFQKGDIVGQVVWHNDGNDFNDDKEAKVAEQGSAARTLHEFIRIRFDANGAISSSTLLNNVPIQIKPETNKEPVLSSVFSLSNNLRMMPIFLGDVFASMSHCASVKALSIKPASIPKKNGRKRNVHDRSWRQEPSQEQQDHVNIMEFNRVDPDPWNPFTECSVSDMISILWKSALNPNSIIIDYVDLPSASLSLSSGITATNSTFSFDHMIKPGLYSGPYAPNIYGKFSREVVLVEYKRYDLTKKSLKQTESFRINSSTAVDGKAGEDVWNIIHKEIFRHGRQRDEGNLFKTLRKEVEFTPATEVVFVLGKKVTGDVHVSAGERTWGAVVYPPIGLNGNNNSSNDERTVPLHRVRDKLDSKEYDVARKWWGFGTLAHPVFRDPAWSAGHLVQLATSPNSSDAFGFSWDGEEVEQSENGNRSTVETTVLRWVDLQDDFL